MEILQEPVLKNVTRQRATPRVVFSVFSCGRNKSRTVLTLKSTVQTFSYTFAVQSEGKIPRVSIGLQSAKMKVNTKGTASRELKYCNINGKL